jgi:hypothetical protein
MTIPTDYQAKFNDDARHYQADLASSFNTVSQQVNGDLAAMTNDAKMFAQTVCVVPSSENVQRVLGFLTSITDPMSLSAACDGVSSVLGTNDQLKSLMATSLNSSIQTLQSSPHKSPLLPQLQTIRKNLNL